MRLDAFADATLGAGQQAPDVVVVQDDDQGTAGDRNRGEGPGMQASSGESGEDHAGDGRGGDRG